MKVQQQWMPSTKCLDCPLQATVDKGLGLGHDKRGFHSNSYPNIKFKHALG